MRISDEKGFTLAELLIAIAITGLIATAAVGILSTGLDTQIRGDVRSSLYQEGMMVMERMTDRVRRCTFLAIPNAHSQTRNILAISGFDNDDNDNYFDDPLFPRIDEDPPEDMNNDGAIGITGIDDDGDGSVDESGSGILDDDENGDGNDDALDGTDNDLDGNIDEDMPADANNDGESGIAGMDDNGDSLVDNGLDQTDDDEDGAPNEDPFNAVIYWVPGGTTFREDHPSSEENRILSERVTFFQVTWQAPNRILIEMSLTSVDNESVTFSEYACPRNTFQLTGKRVR